MQCAARCSGSRSTMPAGSTSTTPPASPAACARARYARVRSRPARLTARAAHLGVVVTKGEVFVSWHRLAGPGKVIVRRGRPDCPGTTADGVAAGEVSRLHVIDLSVKPGAAYCYSVFLREP